jgi:hypothetical protein
MITIDDCKQVCSIEESALFVLNKLVYDYRKAYVQSYDNQTYWDYGINIVKNVKQIERAIEQQTFEFSPLRLVERKVKNKIRKIYVSTWEDKIVERWLNNSLNLLLNHWFTKHSYAYRISDLGVDKCQANIGRIVKNKSFYAKRDIKSYFYTIDQDILLEKISELVDPNNYLYKLLRSRIKFTYCHDGEFHKADLGIPFGSALACTLSNIYLTDLDKAVTQYSVSYFRYADDFLLAGSNAESTLKALDVLDRELQSLNLKTKPSHTSQFSFEVHSEFQLVHKFKFLGLEFFKTGAISLTVEKQRKIFNFYKRALWGERKKILKSKNLSKRLNAAIAVANDVLNNRVRSVAIIDYYLKHINDENKLKILDRLIAELIISTVLNKPFKKKDFKIIPFKKLRELGLISLLHRHRLHKHGHLKVNFLSVRNDLLSKRYYDTIERQRNRINQMKIAKKLRKNKSGVSNGP